MVSIRGAIKQPCQEGAPQPEIDANDFLARCQDRIAGKSSVSFLGLERGTGINQSLEERELKIQHVSKRNY